MSEKIVTTGGCLCGSVKFRIMGPLREVVACHCRQCQKSSGHHVAATRVALSDFNLEPTNSLQWYQSSKLAKRGFCNKCGSNLFWQNLPDKISIFAGSLDDPCGLRLSKHIFVADKADYYDLTDNLAKFAAFE